MKFSDFGFVIQKMKIITYKINNCKINVTCQRIILNGKAADSAGGPPAFRSPCWLCGKKSREANSASPI